MRVDSFGHEIIVKTCLLGIVRMNIYLAKLVVSTDLDDAGTGVDKPLFTLSVALLDDPVEVIDGVGLIFNCQRAGSLFCWQAFLERVLGVFLLRSRTR